MSLHKERIEALDIFRGIGIIFMLMGHIEIGAGFDKYIHAFHMPMFFFVSGYFHKQDKYDSIIKLIFHEARTLLIPYAIFFVMYQILHYIYVHELSITYSVISFFSSNINRIDVAGALWFLLCLFTAKIVFFVIMRISNQYIRFSTVILTTLVGNCIYGFVPLCLDSAMSCMFIMYVGYLMGRSDKKRFIVKFELRNALVLGIIFIFNLVLIMLNGDVNVRRNVYAVIPLTWFNCIVAILCYLNISFWIDCSRIRICTRIKKCLVYIGKNSIVFLILNELVIYLVGQMLKIINFSMIDNVLIRITYKSVVLVLVILMLSIITEIINRTKFRVLIGKF